MDVTKLKLLRSKIDISMHEAIHLLNKNNGNVDACIESIHNQIINDICQLTGCDFETAEKCYNFYHKNKEKAIERIFRINRIFTTRDNPTPKNEIGFILWPADLEGNDIKTLKPSDIFIPQDDFAYIIEVFQSVYPTKNPWSNQIEESFDYCGLNFFEKKTCTLICDRLKQIRIIDQKIMSFIQRVLNWIEDKLAFADYIVIYGNQ